MTSDVVACKDVIAAAAETMSLTPSFQEETLRRLKALRRLATVSLEAQYPNGPDNDGVRTMRIGLDDFVLIFPCWPK